MESQYIEFIEVSKFSRLLSDSIHLGCTMYRRGTLVEQTALTYVRLLQQ